MVGEKPQRQRHELGAVITGHWQITDRALADEVSVYAERDGRSEGPSEAWRVRGAQPQAEGLAWVPREGFTRWFTKRTGSFVDQALLSHPTLNMADGRSSRPPTQPPSSCAEKAE